MCAAILCAASLLPGKRGDALGSKPHATESRSAMTITLTEQDNGKLKEARAGDTLELHLAENATTGYRWQVEPPDAHVLQLQDSSSNYPEGKPGSGGEAVFQFKVVAAGKAELKLNYLRPWEGEAGTLKRFKLTIQAS